ncbi:MAG: M28 family peptidase [Pyrinomonadaceae bacterium]|nr:M28 family peptidase [Pyrinomonadaceae bacterium]MBP6213309.1 M28 family peptidase [Pyrinomonadaceae bacterium]
MKRQLYGYLLILAFVFSAAAQKAQVAKPDPTEANLRKHVNYLASDKLEGRRTGEPGATAAAGYVTNQFAALKLRPGFKTAAGKASFLQPFQYITGVEMGKTGNEFSLELTQGDGKRIKVQNMVPVRPVGFSPNGKALNAPVVFAGYGITSAELKYDDYTVNGTPLDVKGKVVLVFDGNPDNDNPQSAFGRFDPRNKALIAKDKGATGMLIISRETNLDDDKLALMKYDQTTGESALPTFVISRNTAQNILGVSGNELTKVEGMTAMRKDPAVKVTVGFRDTQPIVSYKINLVKKTSAAYNVIGILPGTDPLLKDEAIVIGAHYDHLGRGGQGSLAPNSQEVHHGADDNASGTSAVIELARKFASEKKNRRTMIFVSFSGEEEGLLGSKYYVNNPVYPLEKTVAMLNLDMVGRLNESKLNVGGIGSASEWKTLVEAKNPRQVTDTSNSGNVSMSLAPTFKLQLSEDGYGPSDHASFYGKQVPVLFFFTGTHLDYHKPSDTAEKINFEGLKNINAYVTEIARAIDAGAKRPTYTVAKSAPAPGGGRGGISITLGTIPGFGDSADGMVVDGIRDNSPASAAGIKAGDKIVKLNGRDVRNTQDYMFVMGTMKAGEQYDVVVKRGAETIPLKITPVKRQ